MNATTQFDTLPERDETQRGLVAVAMSGGVDSSTVAALLRSGTSVVSPNFRATAPRNTVVARSTTSMTPRPWRGI